MLQLLLQDPLGLSCSRKRFLISLVSWKWHNLGPMSDCCIRRLVIAPACSVAIPLCSCSRAWDGTAM